MYEILLGLVAGLPSRSAPLRADKAEQVRSSLKGTARDSLPSANVKWRQGDSNP
jgi:hypothetical protein